MYARWSFLWTSVFAYLSNHFCLGSPSWNMPMIQSRRSRGPNNLERFLINIEPASASPWVDTTSKLRSFFPTVAPIAISITMKYRNARSPMNINPHVFHGARNQKARLIKPATIERITQSMIYAAIRLNQWSCNALLLPIISKPVVIYNSTLK